MTRPTQKSLTISYIERNEATEVVEKYLNQLDTNILKSNILTLLFCKYLPVFSREIPREVYEKELIKCLIGIRGLLLTLEKELETTRNHLDSPSNWLKNKFETISHQETSKQQPTTVDDLMTESNYPQINDNDVIEDSEAETIFEDDEKDDEKDDDSSNRTQRILDNFPDYPV